LALGTSDIPWDGPVSAVRIGWSEDKGFLINPSYEERDNLKLDLVVSGPDETINMLEGGANEASEEIVNQALLLAQKEIKSLNEQQKQIIKDIGKSKTEVLLKQIDDSLIQEVHSYLTGKLNH